MSAPSTIRTLFHSPGPEFPVTLEQDARGRFRTTYGQEVGEWTVELTRAALDLGSALIHRGLLAGGAEPHS